MEPASVSLKPGSLQRCHLQFYCSLEGGGDHLSKRASLNPKCGSNLLDAPVEAGDDNASSISIASTDSADVDKGI